jgi:hypothetical protein
VTIVLSSPVLVEDTAPVAGNRPMTWTGLDGVVRQLTKPGNPNPRMRPGVKGLHMPRMIVHTVESPLVPGAELIGYELPPRTVYWPLRFAARSIEQWEDDHASFFDSFHPVIPGIWTVGEGDDARTLPLTGSFDGSHVFDHDPFVTGRALIGVELLAPRPLWRGQAISRSFNGPDPEPFFPEGGGPPFYISPSATFQNASINNPGDEPSYLVWEIDGPQPAGTQVGVGGALVDVPFPVPEGKRLVIDTDPANQYALLGDLVPTDDGGVQFVDPVDVAQPLGFQVFAPVPERGASSLKILATGPGTIRVSHVPLYWRAY